MRGLCTGSLDPEGLVEGDVDSGGDAFRVGYGTRKEVHIGCGERERTKNKELTSWTPTLGPEESEFVSIALKEMDRKD